MSKALKALESIKRTIQQLDYGFISKEDCEDFALIETELKDYEELKAQDKIVDKVWKSVDLPNYTKEARDNNKKLKAFEIIKRAPNEVIEIITTYDNWEEYIKDYPISDKTIWHIIKNKAEFDLLKGALL